MHTILLLDRLGKELLPLTDQTPLPLLPVAARPLIEYTLELLVAAGLKRANVPLNRKVLADLAVNDAAAFKAVVEMAA